MLPSEFSKGLYYVYDGECPLCSHAVHAFRIKQHYGELHLIDVRVEADHPLVREISDRKLDIDDGMVIFADGEIWHGKDALKFVARFGDVKNPFTAVFKSLFWSDVLARVLYPPMRAVRNWLVRRKGIGRIDNLRFSDRPIFSDIFGEDWEKLPPVFKAHYGLRPYSNDAIKVPGHLNVYCKPPLSWAAPLMRLMGQIPPKNAVSVPTTVVLASDYHSKAMHFQREFFFESEKPYRFFSRMIPLGGNEVIEVMRFRFGWKCAFEWRGDKLVLAHRGYALHLFGHNIPLPLSLIMGKGYAEERALSDDEFEMFTHIEHPLWGKVYGYNGRFKIIKQDAV